MQIYINRDGQQFGPFTLDQVNQGLAAGQLLPNDFAFYEGLQQWTPLVQIQGVVLPEPDQVALPVLAQPEVTVTDPTDHPPAVNHVAEDISAEPEIKNCVACGGEVSKYADVCPHCGCNYQKRLIVKIVIPVVVILAIAGVVLFVYPGFLKSQEVPEVKTIKPIIPPPDQPSEPAIQLPDISDVGQVSYFRDIKIIFEEKCVDCHGSKKKKGKLDMSNEQGLAAGADGEPIYVAGKPKESLLVESIYSSDDPMPPDDEDPPLTPLTDEEKKKIIAWIKQGAKTDN